MKQEIKRINQEIILNKELTKRLTESIFRHPANRQEDKAQLIELILELARLNQEKRLLSRNIY